MTASAALPSLSIEIVVPFHDLDPADIVWHGHYVRYLALARDALMESIGYSHLQMRADGVLWPVVEMKLRYPRPARLGQRLRVTATIAEFEQRLKVVYEIRETERGQRLTRGYTVQVPVRVPAGEMLYTAPPKLRECLAAIGHRGEDAT